MRFRLVCIGIVMTIVVAVMCSCELNKENVSGYSIEKMYAKNVSGYSIEKMYARPGHSQYIYKVKTPTETYFVYQSNAGVTVLK